MERASRTLLISSRKKPQDAANFRSEGPTGCNGTSGKSARLSLRASDVTSSSAQEHSKPASGAMERTARDLARMDPELLLNLVRSETRPTSEASSRHPSRTANAKPFFDVLVQMQTSSQRRQSLRRKHQTPPNALRSIRTDHGSPETNYDAHANEHHDWRAPEKTRDH